MTLEVAVAGRVGRFALDAAFATGPGITALFGRSGAGKTTLVNMIAGLVRPERGRIAVNGTVLFDSTRGIDLRPQQRRVGYVFQEGRLFPHLSVRANLLYGRWFTPKAERRAALEPIVEMLGLGTLLQRRPAGLSGGEKQRVAIGRALLASPRLVLLDEPLATLDEARKGEILPYIERLRDELAVPVVYVSHSVAEVARLADTLVLLSDGRVAAAGPVGEVMTRLDLRPLTGRYEASAVLEARVLGHDCEYQLSRLALAGGQVVTAPRIELPQGAAVRLRIRARDVALALERPAGISILNVLEGRVAEIDRAAGPIAELRIDLGGGSLLARITRRSLDELGLEPGSRVFALVKSVAFDRHAIASGATSE